MSEENKKYPAWMEFDARQIRSRGLESGMLARLPSQLELPFSLPCSPEDLLARSHFGKRSEKSDQIICMRATFSDFRAKSSHANLSCPSKLTLTFGRFRLISNQHFSLVRFWGANKRAKANHLYVTDFFSSLETGLERMRI